MAGAERRERKRDRRFRGERGSVIFKLLFLLAALLAAAALAWMLFLPVMLTQQLQLRTGCAASVERFAVNPATGDVDLRGLVLANPPGFPTDKFVHLRAFTAHADLGSLLSARPVFDDVTVDLAEITLVKRADGATNVEVFARALDGAPAIPAAAPVRAAPSKASAPAVSSLSIRRLTVRIEKITIADYASAEPKWRTIDAPVDRVYENVTDLEGLLGAPALGDFAPLGTIVERLVPGVVGRSLSDLARTGGEALREKGRTAEEKVRGLFEALEESRKP
jgi:hypothetical protein